MRPALLLLLAAPMAGCVAAPPHSPVSAGPSLVGTCNNNGIDQFVGQQATQELGSRILGTSGARILRWVAQGQMTTMEFSPERVTVRLSGSNRVESAICG